jgi:hypothetical protein
MLHHDAADLASAALDRVIEVASSLGFCVRRSNHRHLLGEGHSRISCQLEASEIVRVKWRNRWRSPPAAMAVADLRCCKLGRTSA